MHFLLVYGLLLKFADLDFLLLGLLLEKVLQIFALLTVTTWAAAYF
jgi:hypothetical protein